MGARQDRKMDLNELNHCNCDGPRDVVEMRAVVEDVTIFHIYYVQHNFGMKSGVLAEWSKAVRSGRILSWRGFKSHRHH
jgi:hypothetical protein